MDNGDGAAAVTAADAAKGSAGVIADEEWDKTIAVKTVESMWADEEGGEAASPPMPSLAPGQEPPPAPLDDAAEGEFGRLAVETELDADGDSDAESSDSSSFDMDKAGLRTASMRRFFVSQQMKFLRAVDENDIVTNVSSSQDKKKLAKEQQGNEEFYTQEAVAKRARIKSSIEMKRLLKQLWSLMPKTWVPDSDVSAMTVAGHSFEVTADGTVDTAKAFRKARTPAADEGAQTPRGAAAMQIDLATSTPAPAGASAEEEVETPPPQNAAGEPISAGLLPWQVGPPGHTAVINQNIYFALCARLFRRLVKEAEPEECLRVLKTEWRKDSANGEFLTFQGFCATIFETIDVWCPSVDMDHYREFSDKVLKPIAQKVCVLSPEAKFKLSSVFHEYKEKRRAVKPNVGFGRHIRKNDPHAIRPTNSDGTSKTDSQSKNDAQSATASPRGAAAGQTAGSPKGGVSPRAAAAAPTQERIDELAQSKRRGDSAEDGTPRAKAARSGEDRDGQSPRERAMQLPVQTLGDAGLHIGRAPSDDEEGASDHARRRSGGQSSGRSGRSSRASSALERSGSRVRRGASDPDAQLAEGPRQPQELKIVNIGSSDPLLYGSGAVRELAAPADLNVSLHGSATQTQQQQQPDATPVSGQRNVLVLEDATDRALASVLGDSAARREPPSLARLLEQLRNDAPTMRALIEDIARRAVRPTELRLCVAKDHGDDAVTAQYSALARFAAGPDTAPLMVRDKANARAGRTASADSSRASERVAAGVAVVNLCLHFTADPAKTLRNADDLIATVTASPAVAQRVPVDFSAVNPDAAAKLAAPPAAPSTQRSSSRGSRSSSRGSHGDRSPIGDDAPTLQVQEPTRAFQRRSPSQPVDTSPGYDPLSDTAEPDVLTATRNELLAEDPDLANAVPAAPAQQGSSANTLEALANDATGAPKLEMMSAMPRSEQPLAESDGSAGHVSAARHGTHALPEPRDRYAIVFPEPTVAVAHKTAIGRKLTKHRPWREQRTEVPVPPRPQPARTAGTYTTQPSALIETAKTRSARAMPQIVSASNIAADVNPDDNTLEHLKRVVPTHAANTRGKIVCLSDEKPPQPRDPVTLMGSTRPLASAVASQANAFTTYEPYDAPALLHKLTNTAESVVTRYVHKRVDPHNDDGRAPQRDRGCGQLESVIACLGASSPKSQAFQHLASAAAAGVVDATRGMTDVDVTGTAKKSRRANTSKLGRLDDATQASKRVREKAQDEMGMSFDERTSVREAEVLAGMLASRHAKDAATAGTSGSPKHTPRPPKADGASPGGFSLAPGAFASPPTPRRPERYEQRHISHARDVNRPLMLGGSRVLGSVPHERTVEDFVRQQVMALPEAGSPPSDAAARKAETKRVDEFDPRRWSQPSEDATPSPRTRLVISKVAS